MLVYALRPKILVLGLPRDPPPIAEPPFTASDEFAAKFELRYEPEFGSYPDAHLRMNIYNLFWEDVQNGIDAFALCQSIRRSRVLADQEREEAIKDLMALANSSR